MTAAEHAPDQRFTYADYLKWDDGKRWELIHGVPYDMSPMARPAHQIASGELHRQIANFLLDKRCQVIATLDVRLPGGVKLEADDRVDTVVQPDLAVICDSEKIDDRGCNGAPDLVIEILSESTASHDLGTKRELYEQSGVREYWVVNLWDKSVMVYRPDAEGRYGIATVYGKEQILETPVLAGLKVELATVLK